MPGEDRPTGRLSYELLHQRAREFLTAGVLPRDDPRQTYGGYGTGRHCQLCEAPITAQEVEYELEFETGNEHPADKFLVCLHLGCHAIWEYERRRIG
jgi:hypothetical protein